MQEINIKKRNGVFEQLDIKKINKMLEWACQGIDGVSASEIAMNSKLQLYDGITSDEIQQVLINSCVDLISEEQPKYDLVAGKLFNVHLRKKVFNTFDNLPTLYSFINSMVESGRYNKKLMEDYTKEEIDAIDNKILNHYKDLEYTYASVRQMTDKYLIKNRKTDEIYETPQFVFVAIAMSVCSNISNKQQRLQEVKSKYLDYSDFYISLSTPVIAGIRTNSTQYSSCVLIECADSLESINATSNAIVTYTAKRAGIGLNVGRIRAEGDSIRGGEVIHTGLIPYLKTFESNTKSVHQNGLRGGGGTVFVPFWHKQIKEVIVLKNNKGSIDKRVRKLDYCIQFSRIFYERFLNNDFITLFSPNEVPELYNTFGLPEFDELYKKYESDKSISKEFISARELMSDFIIERLETGRIYLQNIDNVNSHTNFITDKNQRLSMSNLCLTGDTKILVRIDGIERLIMLGNLDILFKSKKYNIEVLSYNTSTKQKEFKKITNSVLTAKNSKVIKITDTVTNKTIKCTPEHEIFTHNRGYVMAKDLVHTDILEINQ